MTIERGNPIPPGIYYIDAIGEDRVQGFRFWSNLWGFAHPSGSPAVELIKSEVIQSDPKAGVWYLFRVLKPVERWPDDMKIGLPSVAPSGAKTTQAELVQRPPPETISDMFGDALGTNSSIKTLAIGAGLGLGALLLVKVILR